MSTESTTPTDILVSLDALLDTRLPVAVDTMGLPADEAIPILMKNGYLTRKTFAPEGVDAVRFKELYADRNALHLLDAIRTPIIENVLEMVVFANKRRVTCSELKPTHVVINVHPYVLSPEDQALIAESIGVMLHNKCGVGVVSIPYSDLTPDYLKTRYEFMVMYDYPQWLDIQASNFKDKECRALRVLVPAVYFGRELTDEEKATIEVEWGKENPLLLVLLGTADKVNLEFLPPELFSAAI